MQLSKSEYMMFLKHPAWLWLKKNQKHLLPSPNAALQALFDAGHKYELYAEQLFPGGVRLGFNNYGEHQTLPERTRAAFTEGANTVFQGRFECGQTTCIVDVLLRVEVGFPRLCQCGRSRLGKDVKCSTAGFLSWATLKKPKRVCPTAAFIGSRRAAATPVEACHEA